MYRWLVVVVYLSQTLLGYTESRTNIARGKTVNQSTTLYYGKLDHPKYHWSAELAIDGQTRFTGDQCKCCAGAGYESPGKGPWWEIDLGTVVKVGKVKVYGRTDAFRQLYGFRMYASDTTPYKTSSAPYVYINDISVDDYLNKHGAITDILFGDTPLRYVALALDKTRNGGSMVLMVICEVEIYEACPDYHFEPDCAECHCQGDPCNKTTGVCPSGQCVPGWKTPRCDQECDNGTFGSGCSSSCHCMYGSCNKTTGVCLEGGCLEGFKGDKCDTECTNKKYGRNCQNTCGNCINDDQCDTRLGNCTACIPGYRMPLCNETCYHGLYGAGCQSMCSGHCFENATCHHVYGTCTKCAPGFQGTYCNQTCQDGKYGVNCENDCGHCIQGTSSCNKDDGHCRGGCAAGYKTDKCDTECDSGTFGQRCEHQCGNCYRGAGCNVSHGQCPGKCEAGYQGVYCNTTCGFGFYGVSCESQCGHCLNNMTCNMTSGVCNDGCDPGYIGATCHLRKDKLSADSDNVIGPVVGVVVTILVLLILAVIVVVIRRRRRFISKDTVAPPALGRHNQMYVNTREIALAPVANGESLHSTIPVASVVGVQKEPSVIEGENVEIHQLWDYIQAKKENFAELFYKEYNSLKGGLIHEHNIGALLTNKTKHKYRDMYAYDYNRVTLECSDDTESDYINASYIDGFNRPKKFIASQGPIKSMIDDFWRMIWQQRSEIIVMLTNLVEVGKTKCMQYWPSTDVQAFGRISVRLLSTETYTDFDVRHLEVSESEACDSRHVTQFHFKSWPDKNIPDSAWCLVSFWRAVDMAAASTPDVPIIVHCSAGVGRTGTYIALDNTYYQGQETGSVNPLTVVKDLRNHRINMVQTKDQYVYLHEAVAEAFLFGTHYLWSSQFEEYYEYMSENAAGQERTRFELQFDLIEESFELEKSDMVYANLAEGQSSQRAQLKPINLQNYNGKETLVVSALPRRTPPLHIWTQILNLDVCAVINIPDEKGFHLDSDVCGQFGSVNVTMTEEQKDPNLTEKSFQITKDGKDVSVKVFECSFWPVDTLPEVGSFLKFSRTILDTQYPSEANPLLIFCSDGSTRSGLTCALLSELSRIHYDDGHMNFVHTVKCMKERCGTIIPTSDQYLYCYEVILKSITNVEEPDNVYQNT